ncbi:4'-phosphopantetheinyl transferase family protein [Bacillus pseudomycoides]|uniref:4'-phosphopantetheinyl transferase family protein n=1 Tax=Bacillus pseudomycoides TaxID=64104 RepID=UPI000BFC7F12|nr:4'-phosphopantetheinyl transferase superfamily protein [Bacillus pseudomycoides]PGD99984.1 4-phosphopantetheinyl transferase [Bacillus pseudomycoides]PHG23840.1 4-phosphopantetheinyl transferase [Bacillus pseudomycoides]
MINIYAIKKPYFIDENRYNALLSLVSTEKKKKINRYVKKEEAYRSLLGDVLIRSVICKQYKIFNQDIKYDYNEYGKPYWKGSNHFSFNISHSEDWIVCIVDKFPVGIDIEKICPANLEIGSHFFSDEEVEDLNAKSSFGKVDYFYDLWTLKESYIKAIGKGLSIPLNSFTIKKNKEEDIIVKQDGFYSSYFFTQYQIDSKYKLSVCATSNRFPKKVIIKDISEIAQDVLRNNNITNL